MAESAFVVTFGKYKGYDIRDVPTDYIEWFIGEGDPKTARYRMFDKELKRRNAEAEDAQPVVTPKEPPTFVPEKETKEEPAEDLMVVSRKKIEDLVASAVSRGYNEAYNRMAINIRAISFNGTFNVARFKQELLSSVRENRVIDSTKFNEVSKTENTVGHDDKASARKSWYSQDNRK
jgi:hypothetical protein